MLPIAPLTPLTMIQMYAMIVEQIRERRRKIDLVCEAVGGPMGAPMPILPEDYSARAGAAGSVDLPTMQ